MNTNARIFAETTSLFFPRWRSRPKWHLRTGCLNGGHGFCDSKRKKILIGSSPTDAEGKVVLIHEIVHAVTGSGHDKRFISRLLQCAKTAQEKGISELAALLKNEAELWSPEKSLRITSTTIYVGIADALLQCPKASFTQVVDFVRRDVGMSRREFLRRYKRARRIYDATQRDIAEEKSIREAAEARRRLQAIGGN